MGDTVVLKKTAGWRDGSVRMGIPLIGKDGSSQLVESEKDV
jgi:hypothetical protein